MNSVSAQTVEFFYSALMGTGLGALFDFFRVIRFYVPQKRILTFVFDVLFWCFAIIILLAFVLTVSGGKMRWYVLVGTFCGGFVYVSAVSEIMFRVGVSLVFLTGKILRSLTNPIYLLFRWIWRSFLSFSRKASCKCEKGKVKERRVSRAEE